jgi:hypothetical protein
MFDWLENHNVGACVADGQRDNVRLENLKVAQDYQRRRYRCP